MVFHMSSQTPSFGSLLTQALASSGAIALSRPRSRAGREALQTDEPLDADPSTTLLVADILACHIHNEPDRTEELDITAPAPAARIPRLLGETQNCVVSQEPVNAATEANDLSQRVQGQRIQNSDIMTVFPSTTSPYWSTTKEAMNWLDHELAKHESSILNVHQVSTPQPIRLGVLDTRENGPSQTQFVSAREDEVIIQRGFGTFEPLPQSAVMDERLRSYPPLSNAAYDLTTYGIDAAVHERLMKKKSRASSFHGNETPSRNQNTEPFSGTSAPTIGEIS